MLWENYCILREFYFFSLFIISCLGDDDLSRSAQVPKNKVPSEFVVSPSNVTHNSISINWTQSIDPEGTEVTYNIYSSIDNELLVSGLTDANRSYEFKNLPPLSSFNYYVVSEDRDGNKRLSITPKIITKQNFPPNSFDIVITRLFFPPISGFKFDWTNALDPEGTKVVYDLYLIENYGTPDPIPGMQGVETNTYTISSSSISFFFYYYQFLVVARDSDGFSTQAISRSFR